MQASDWRLPEHPAFELFDSVARARLNALDHFPTPSELARLGSGIPSACPLWFTLCEQRDQELRTLGGFDRFIAERRSIPTRLGSTHDLLGGLVWLHFAATKTAIHRLQLGSNVRGPRENAATHLDESGVLVVSSEPNVFERFFALAWPSAFLEHRADLVRSTRFLAFGHGLLDALRSPHPRLMGKALFVRVSEAQLARSPSELRVFIDGALAERLPDFLREPSCLHPLPVLGIPDWWPGQDRAFYEDERYFRTARTRPSQATAPRVLDLSR